MTRKESCWSLYCKSTSNLSWSHLDFTPLLQDGGNSNLSLEAREGEAEADVRAEAEGEVLIDLAMDVEPIGLRIATVVAIGGAHEEQHRVARGHGLAVLGRHQGCPVTNLPA